MKLPESGIVIEESGSMTSHHFSIDENDQGIIFDILRSKIYSNPIESICREIASNSRDANREVGKGDVPIIIEIVDASIIDNSSTRIVFKDNGPGISPERMENVFCKYAASTKRDSNDFTGGYGLGAKTPFSYTDCFNISTIYDGKKYEYAAYIDESKRGKITLLNTSEVKEESGTAISIPIKDNNDLNEFIKYSINSTMYWDILPKLINFKGESYKSIVKIFSNENFSISNNSYSYRSKVRILIDGISYEIDNKMLQLNEIHQNIRISSNEYYDIFLKFNPGELDISANRETLHYTENTKNLIYSKIESIINYLSNEFKDKVVSKIENFAQACTLLYSLSKNDFYEKNYYLDSIFKDQKMWKSIAYSIYMLSKYIKKYESVIEDIISPLFVKWEGMPSPLLKLNTYEIRVYSKSYSDGLSSYTSSKLDYIPAYNLLDKNFIFFLLEGYPLNKNRIISILEKEKKFILVRPLKYVKITKYSYYTDEQIKKLNKEREKEFNELREKDNKFLKYIIPYANDMSKIEIKKEKKKIEKFEIVYRYFSRSLSFKNFYYHSFSDIKRIITIISNGLMSSDGKDNKEYILKFFEKVSDFKLSPSEICYDRVLEFIYGKSIRYIEKKYEKKLKEIKNVKTYNKEKNELEKVYDFSMRCLIFLNLNRHDIIKLFPNEYDIFKKKLGKIPYDLSSLSLNSYEVDRLIDFFSMVIVYVTTKLDYDKSKNNMYVLYKEVLSFIEKYKIAIVLEQYKSKTIDMGIDTIKVDEKDIKHFIESMNALDSIEKNKITQKQNTNEKDSKTN